MRPFLHYSFLFFLIVLFLTGCCAKVPHLIIDTDSESLKIQIERVVSDEAKRKGLMGREFLADGTGMLFIYPADVNPVMWMKGMLIPLDMVFIDKYFKIIHIEQNLQPCEAQDDSQCALYRSPFPSSYVLELPAGFVSHNGIALGNQITLPL